MNHSRSLMRLSRWWLRSQKHMRHSQRQVDAVSLFLIEVGGRLQTLTTLYMPKKQFDVFISKLSGSPDRRRRRGHDLLTASPNKPPRFFGLKARFVLLVLWTTVLRLALAFLIRLWCCTKNITHILARQALLNALFVVSCRPMI